MNREDFKAKVSMALGSMERETWEDFLEAVWQLHLEASNHWIPVEEYPKVDMSCTLLVHYVDGTIDICDYYGDFYDYIGENVTRNVTHWMPLPQAPKEEDNK